MIDLAKLLETRRRARVVAAEHPDLVSHLPPTEACIDALVGDLEEPLAEHDKPLNLRVSGELLERIDRYAERTRQRAKALGIPARVTRSNAARRLLEIALDAEEGNDGEH